MGCLVEGPCMLIEDIVCDLRKSIINSPWYDMATNLPIGVQAAPQAEELQPVVRGFNKDYVLVGEFSLLLQKNNPKYQVKVSYTEITFTPWPAGGDSSEAPLVVKLDDVIGVDCTRGRKYTDRACYLNLYSYQRKKETLAQPKNVFNISGRKRKTYTIIFDKKGIFTENEVAAQTWKNMITYLLKQGPITEDTDLSSLELPAPRRMLVLINPFSGPGKALQIFQEKVVPMFAEAGIHFNLVVTERAGHAYDLVRDLRLDEWYGIIIVSGDGLVYEVMNGLMQRGDWPTARHTPIGVIPGGSGNALSCSLSFYSGESFLDKHIQSAAFIIAKHLQPLPLDLVAIDTCTGRRLYSFLCVNWGYMSDVDIESEKMRMLGSARFTVYSLIRLVGLRKYRGRVSFLPVTEYTPRQLKRKFRRTQSEIYTYDSDIQTVTMKRTVSTVAEGIESSMDTESGSVSDAGCNGNHRQMEAAVDFGIDVAQVNQNGTVSADGSMENVGGVSVAGDGDGQVGEVSEKNNGYVGGASDMNDEQVRGAGEPVNGHDMHKASTSAESEHLSSDSFTDIDMSSVEQSMNSVSMTASSDHMRKNPVGTSYMKTDHTGGSVVETPLLAPLSSPVPSDWVSLQGEFITVAVLNTTHLGPDLIFSKERSLNEGELDLCIIHGGLSRTRLLKSFLDLAEGKVKPGGHIEFLRVKAFRIEPFTDRGYMVVDGEVVDYGAIQGQVLPGMAKIMGRERPKK